MKNQPILKRILHVFFVVLTFSQLVSAQILVTDTADCAPFTDVQFNSSAGIGNWDFGDGTSAIGVDNAKHTFGTPGTYTVTFSQGGSIVDEQEIIVFGNPNPKFSFVGDSSGCIPYLVPFVDESTGDGTSTIVGWDWTFGDGGASTDQNPSYTYSLVGEFTVSLIVTDDNGCDSALVIPKLISTSTPPNASFTNTSMTSCTPPLTVDVTNTSTNSTGGSTNLTYAWDFGGGNTSTLADPADATYSVEGPISISLTVTEDGGCSDVFTRTGNIGKPTAAFTIADTICINKQTQFFNSSIGGTSWSWNFSNGNTSNQQNPITTFATGGIQSATLTATQSGCSHDTTISFFVQEIIPDFIIVPSYLCNEPWCMKFTETSTGGADNFSWTFDDGAGGSGDTITHCYLLDTNIYTVYDPLFYDVTMTATSKWGCSAAISHPDTIYPVSAFFSPDTAMGCAPLEVNFSDSTRSRENIVSWDWDFGDGNTSNVQNPNHTYPDTGHYTVTLIVENSFGCRDTSYPVVIQVGEEVPLDFSISQNTVCLGDSVTFTDITGDSRIDYWHFTTDEGRSGTCPDQSTQSWAFFNETGLQDVTFFANVNGCISDTTFKDAITVNGPSSNFTSQGNCDTPYDYTFDADLNDVLTFTWDFGDGTTLTSVDVNDTLINHTYAAEGDYTVYFISSNAISGCANDTDSTVVHVREIYAEITGDSTLCSGEAYTFYSDSSKSEYNSCNDGFRWDLGDGTEPTITAGNMNSFLFPDTGIYEIRLIAKDINLCYDTAYREVRVTNIDVGFTMSDSTGCMPLTIAFTDTSISDTLFTNWTWTVDNVTNSTVQNPNITFTDVTKNSFQITLTAQDSLGCVDSKTKTVYPIIPDTNFTANDRTLCVGDSALFTLSGGAKIATAAWDFGDGGASNDLNPYHTFNTAGDFTVSVAIVDTNGCPGTRTRTTYIEVDAYPEALFWTNVDTNSVICYPVQISFTDTSIVNTFGSRVWDLGVPNPILPNTTVSWNYDQPGTYTTSLIERTSNGCADTLEKSFEIVGPIANFDLSKSTICVGESITFTMKDSADVETFLWDFGDGTSQSGIDPITHQFTEVPNGGTTNVQLVIWSEDSVCDYVTVKPVTVHEVEARFDFADSTICDNEQAQFVNNSIGATSYFWDFDNGSNSTATNPVPQSYGTIGKYDVSLIVENDVLGCIDTLIKELEVLPRPVVTAIGNAMCSGDSALLSANGATTYSWVDPTLVADPDSANTWSFPTETTTFTVTGTDTNNCSNTASVEVIVFEEPTAYTFDSACHIIGQYFTIGRNYGGSYVYDWTVGTTDYLNCTTCPVQTLQIKDEIDPIQFTVEYTDTLGCYATRDIYNICIFDNYTVDVPSAFTPNGEGENDIIYVKGHGIEELIYFRIYNRWGEMIFETNDINVGWNGTYKGEAQNMETYIYQAKVRFYNQEYEEKGGSITLIR